MTELTLLIQGKATPYQETTNDLQVEVFPYYVEEQSDASRSFYFFAYRIKISNVGSSRVLQLLSRHWIIRNGKGQEEEVKGEGVVGQKPILSPGEFFEYTSFCPLNTPTGNMRGKFEMMVVKNAGVDCLETYSANVPVFFFRLPHTIH